MKHHDNNPVLFYKEQGSILAEIGTNYDISLGIDDFALVIQTPLQAEVLQTCGNLKVVCADATHGTNSYNFQLISVLLLIQRELFMKRMTCQWQLLILVRGSCRVVKNIWMWMPTGICAGQAGEFFFKTSSPLANIDIFMQWETSQRDGSARCAIIQAVRRIWLRVTIVISGIIGKVYIYVCIDIIIITSYARSSRKCVGVTESPEDEEWYCLSCS